MKTQFLIPLLLLLLSSCSHLGPASDWVSDDYDVICPEWKQIRNECVPRKVRIIERKQ